MTDIFRDFGALVISVLIALVIHQIYLQADPQLLIILLALLTLTAWSLHEGASAARNERLRASNWRTLLQHTRNLRSALNPEEVAKKAEEACSTLGNHEIFLFGFIDERKNELHFVRHSLRGVPVPIPPPRPSSDGLMGLVLSSQTPLYIRDILSDKHLFAASKPAPLPEKDEKEVHGLAAVPLLQDGRVVGVMSLQTFNMGQYNRDFRTRMETIGEHVAAALHASALYRKAIEDGLTQLYNRSHMNQAAEDFLAEGQAFTLILLDLDKFKHVNDTLGHVAGDQLLAKMKGLLQTASRSEDIACRYGGDEFAILLPKATPSMGEAVAERLRLLISQAFSTYTPPVTASIGVVSWRPTPHTDPPPIEDLIDVADQALYRAKTKCYAVEIAALS